MIACLRVVRSGSGLLLILVPFLLVIFTFYIVTLVITFTVYYGVACF